MSDPFNHPWLGGLFHDDGAAAILSPKRQMAHMLTVEAAYTRALGAVGTVPQDTAEAIAQKIETFAPDLAELRAATAQDGVPVPGLVRQLRAAFPEQAGAIHNGATSQDIVDTALALTLREVSELLQSRLAETARAITALTATFGAHKIMGRTRMQAALPISVEHRLAAWVTPLNRHADRLKRLRPDTEMLQLGGAVGDRSTLGPQGDAIAKVVAETLRLGLPDDPRHTTRDAVVDYANLLALITGSLGKMGQDVCLMAQQGIDEIALSGGGASSAMPHKQNPVAAETLVTLARFNATQIAGMHHAMVHEQERSGAAWALEWMILPQMAHATCRSLTTARDLCASITKIGAS